MSAQAPYLGIVEVVTPELLLELLNGHTELRGVHRGEGPNGETLIHKKKTEIRIITRQIDDKNSSEFMNIQDTYTYNLVCCKADRVLQRTLDTTLKHRPNETGSAPQCKDFCSWSQIIASRKTTNQQTPRRMGEILGNRQRKVLFLARRHLCNRKRKVPFLASLHS